MVNPGNRHRRSERPRAVALLSVVSLFAVLVVVPPVALAKGSGCFGQQPTIKGSHGDDKLEGTNGDDVIVTYGGRDVIDGRGGSDRICGGGGNDVLKGGPGSADRLEGGSGNDTLDGGKGTDLLSGGTGSDRFKGGAGTDILDYSGSANGIDADLAEGAITGDGNDTVVSSVEGLFGSNDNDSLLGDDSGQFLYGQDGDDTINGRGGDDTIGGEAGNDALNGGGSVGLGDILDMNGAPEGVTVDVGQGISSGYGNDTLRDFEIVLGSDHDDLLIGGDGNDLMLGADGNDDLRGLAGDYDILRGGNGDDVMDGGEGVLDFVSFPFADSPVVANLITGVATGEGNDTFVGIEALGGSHGFGDVLQGDELTNMFFGFGGDDEITGGDGVDVVLFGLANGPVTLDLAEGTAVGEGNDSLAEVEGVYGSQFGDTLVGDEGDNILNGWLGNDVIRGGPGDDYMSGETGNDSFDGGPGGYDMVDFLLAPGALTVDLSAGTATGEGNDTLTGVEAVSGSDFPDDLIGDSSDNFLFGGGGNDVISGAEGTDGIDGGLGSDTTDGGPGEDGCASSENGTSCETAATPPQHPLFTAAGFARSFGKRHTG